MKTNYHGHTTRCKHAVGTDEEYVLSAIKAGYNEIGFSDHCPWPFENGFISPMRMDLSQLEDYVGSVTRMKERYKDQITIKIGLECEYFEEYMPWLQETVRQYSLDYLIFGNHFPENEMTQYYSTTPGHTKKAVTDYLKTAIKGMESQLFAYLAHPDVFMRSYPIFDEHCKMISYKLCQKARELNIPLEYNLSGFKGRTHKNGYPHPDFWRIAAEVGCLCIIGLDAHDPHAYECEADYQQALNEIKALKLRRIKQLDEVIL